MPTVAASLKDWSPLPPTSYARARPLVLPPLELELVASLDVPPQAERATARVAVATPATVIRDTRRMELDSFVQAPIPGADSAAA
jgi:hypothetical protein